MRGDSIISLRRSVSAGTGSARPAPPFGPGRLPLGISHADAWLDGGLRGDGLHEFYAASSGDGINALGFALLLGWKRHREDGRLLLWAREGRGADGNCLPYGPGLAELGVDPAMIRLLRLPDGKAVLRASLDAVRAGAVSAILIELGGKQRLLDLTTTRRLVLAAAETGTMVLLARSDAGPSPSAAHTRWQIAPAPSCMLEADAPGLPSFDLVLLRQRGGRDGLNIIVEWDRDTASFQERGVAAAAPLPRAVPAVDARRTGEAGRDRAA